MVRIVMLRSAMFVRLFKIIQNKKLEGMNARCCFQRGP